MRIILTHTVHAYAKMQESSVIRGELECIPDFSCQTMPIAGGIENRKCTIENYDCILGMLSNRRALIVPLIATGLRRCAATGLSTSLNVVLAINAPFVECLRVTN